MGAVPFQFFCPLRKKGDSKAAEGAEKGDNVVVLNLSGSSELGP